MGNPKNRKNELWGNQNSQRLKKGKKSDIKQAKKQLLDPKDDDTFEPKFTKVLQNTVNILLFLF